MRQLNLAAPCLGLALALAAFAACNPANAAPSPPVWLYAVVFHLSGGAANYAGVADVSAASGTLQQLLSQAPAPTERSKSTLSAPPGADDIWLEGNGCSEEVVWNPAARTYAVVQNARMSHSMADNGVFTRAVASCREYMAPPGFGVNAASPSACTAIGDSLWSPSTLAEMVSPASIIVRGTVAAVLREQHMPENYNGPMQSTVLLVAVERYLRGGGADAPRVVKAVAIGGDLPWVSEQGGQGVGFRMLDDPMPALGARYILFLRRGGPPGPLGSAAQGPAYGEANGIRGKVSEADELAFTEPWSGKILLQGDVAMAMPKYGKTTEWKFDDGEQIVGIPASQTEAAILHAVAEVDAKHAGDPAGGRAEVPFGAP